jgi:hypothetical protein
MSINLNVFLELVGLVTFTDREFGAEMEIWPFYSFTSLFGVQYH